jgi:hypothetical protein
MVTGAIASINMLLHNSGGRLGQGFKVEGDAAVGMTLVVGCSVKSFEIPSSEPGSTTHLARRESLNQISDGYIWAKDIQVLGDAVVT